MKKSYVRNINGREHRPLSSIVIAHNVLGFRESAALMKVADDSGCRIRLASGNKKGSTDSVLSLMSMGLAAGNSVVLSVEGNDEASAIDGCARVLHAHGAL